jgi:hypothetical protein
MKVYGVLITQLPMVVIRKKAAIKKSLAKMINMIPVIQLHLMSYVGLLEFIKDSYKHEKRRTTHPLLLQHKIKRGYPNIETADF